MARAIFSGPKAAILLPTRSMANVRTWLIFTPERLGSPLVPISQIKGNPALWGRLVTAMAITVPERSLKTS